MRPATRTSGHPPSPGLWRDRPHNEVLVSMSQVKPGVVPRKSRPLPGETCPAGVRVRERSNGTVTGNSHGERTGVSRGRSSAGKRAGSKRSPQVGCAESPGESHARAKDQTGQDCGDRGGLPTGAVTYECQLRDGAAASGGERLQSGRATVACYYPPSTTASAAM